MHPSSCATSPSNPTPTSTATSATTPSTAMRSNSEQHPSTDAHSPVSMRSSDACSSRPPHPPSPLSALSTVNIPQSHEGSVVDPEDLQSQFKIAANALTQIYKRAWRLSKRDQKAGYVLALQDMWQACEQLSRHPLTMRSGARAYVPLDVVLDTLVQRCGLGGSAGNGSAATTTSHDMAVDSRTPHSSSPPPHSPSLSDVTMNGGGCHTMRTAPPSATPWSPAPPPQPSQTKDQGAQYTSSFVCTHCGKPVPYTEWCATPHRTNSVSPATSDIFSATLPLCTHCRTAATASASGGPWGVDPFAKGPSHYPGDGLKWNDPSATSGPMHPIGHPSGSTPSTLFPMNRKWEGFRKRIREG